MKFILMLLTAGALLTCTGCIFVDHHPDRDRHESPAGVDHGEHPGDLDHGPTMQR